MQKFLRQLRFPVKRWGGSGTMTVAPEVRAIQAPSPIDRDVVRVLLQDIDEPDRRHVLEMDVETAEQLVDALESRIEMLRTLGRPDRYHDVGFAQRYNDAQFRRRVARLKQDEQLAAVERFV